MSQCEFCGNHSNMPYSCSYCGRTFCKRHRMPENHNCANLADATSPSTADLSEENLRTASNAYWGSSNNRKKITYLAIISLVAIALAATYLIL
nr:AN1-type zinc finger protein [Natronococcus sp. AD5]